MIQTSGLTVVLFSFLFFALQQPENILRQVDQEKQSYVLSPAANWYSPNLLKKVDALMEKAQQSLQAGDANKGNLLAQQARWLIPDPNTRLPAQVSRVLGSLKFKHEGAVCAAIYAPDGKTLITAGQDGTVRHWDLANGRTKTTWDIGKPLSVLAVSPDQKWLAVAEGYRPSPGFDAANLNVEDNHAIHVYELATGQKHWQLAGHGKNAVMCLVFSPDSQRLASGCQIGLGDTDGIKIWDIKTGKEDSPPKVSYGVLALVWATTGDRIYAAINPQNNNYSVAVVNVTSGNIDRSNPREGKIYALALSPDGSTLAVAGEINDGSSGTHLIRLYSTKTWTASNLPSHQNAILALAYSRDGKTLVSSSAKPEAAIRVWNLTTKTQLAQYQGHGGDVVGLALRPDGGEIASVSLDQSIRLWQAATAKPPRVVARHNAPIWNVVLGAGDKQFLTVSADQTAAIWDLQGAVSAPKLKYLEHHAPVTAGVYRPDFQEVATGGGDQIIRLWNPETGQTNATLPGHTGVITSLCYSPDGKRLYSGSSDRTVKAWDLTTKKVLYTLTQHRSVVTAVAVNLDGSVLASGGADNVVRLWNAADGKELKALVGHTAAVTALAFSPGGLLVTSVGADGKVIFWDAQTGTQYPPRSAHVGQIMALAFSANLKYLATGGADEVVRIWNVLTKDEIRALQGHTDWVTSIAFLRDNESLISSSVDGTVRLWEASQSAEIPSYGHVQAVRCLAMSPHGDQLASGSEDGQIILWDPKTGNDLRTLNGHLASVVSLAFSNDGKLLLAGDREQKLKLWEVNTGKELSSLTLKGIPTKVGFLAKDRGIAAWTGNAEVYLWPLTDQPAPRINAASTTSFIGTEQHPNGPNAVSIAQDRIVLGTTDGNAKSWQVGANFKAESSETIPCFNEAIYGQTMNAAGTRLLSINQESQIKWFSVEPKKQLRSWKGRDAKAVSLAAHPQLDLVLVGFESHEVVLWNAATGKELRSWKFRGPINDLVFAAEAQHAYAASNSGVIYQLELP